MHWSFPFTIYQELDRRRRKWVAPIETELEGKDLILRRMQYCRSIVLPIEFSITTHLILTLAQYLNSEKPCLEIICL